MKILILCAQPHSINTNHMINSLSTIYAYHFHKWLSKYDCEIFFESIYLSINKIKTIENYDFCLVLANRGVKKMKPLIYQELRKITKYHIITICEGNKYVGKEDLLLFIMGEPKPKTMRLHWGADFDLLKPNKPNIITILVDHQYYGKKSSRMFKNDKTEIFIKSLLKYKNDGHNIIIKHIGNGEIIDVNNDYIIERYKQSYAMDFRKIYENYNEAHIFIVTHMESFGLTTIECASAGALIVQPSGYIKEEIIKKLHNVTITDMENINWDNIINKIDIAKSIKGAKMFSYENASNKLYHYMKKVSQIAR